MPNHVYSQLRVEASPNTIDAIIDFVKDENRTLSADKIMPMPPELREVTSPVRIVSEEEYAAWKVKPKTNEWDRTGPITERMRQEYLQKFGATDWYTWANANWGTKWGFYNTSEWEVNPEAALISFQTAWSPATPIITKLAAQFPEAKITYSFADEGGGFVGYQVYEDGEEVEECDFEWRSPEGIEVRKLVGYWFEDEDEEDDTE